MPRDDLWEILYRRQGGRCTICNEKFCNARRPNKKWLRSKFLNLDHRRPQSHGGTDDLANLDLTHKPCNSRKGDSCEGCEFCQPEDGPRLPAWNFPEDEQLGGLPDYYIHAKCEETICPGTDVPHG